MVIHHTEVMISHNSKQPGTVISSTYFEYCDFYILA